MMFKIGKNNRRTVSVEPLTWSGRPTRILSGKKLFI
jgi:hypothetical protein